MHMSIKNAKVEKGFLIVFLSPSQIENEENVLVCLKIIIELHKQYRPQMNEEVMHVS